LRTHPEHLLAGGRAKAPLRRMVAEHLPGVTLPSKKIDFRHMVHDILRPRCGARWQKMGGPLALTDLRISNADALQSAIRDYATGHSQNSHLVWRILSTETWLRRRTAYINSLKESREVGRGACYRV